MAVKIQLRRDTSTNWSSINPVLDLGEPGFEIDTNKLKLGDGISAWNDLIYLTPDFINIVSSGGIANLTVEQQSEIVEGTIVLTTDGVRWVYTGTGSVLLEASYIQLADISPAWIQVTGKPASIVGLADIVSSSSGDFILATGNNTYQVTNFAENVDDRVGQLVVAGSGIVLNYNDSGNALTISSSGATLEQVQDNLGTSFLVAGTGISLSYNDGSDTLTINATSVANSGDNRILTSTGTNTGINAEANMTFNGTSLIVSGNAKFTQVHPTVSDVATTSGSITSNISTGQIFDITINGSTTLSNPTNSIDGVTVRWRITQGGSGSNSISLGGKFNIPSSATSPLPWSTGVGATDILAATYDSGRDEWDVIAFVPGY